MSTVIIFMHGRRMSTLRRYCARMKQSARNRRKRLDTTIAADIDPIIIRMLGCLDFDDMSAKLQSAARRGGLNAADAQVAASDMIGWLKKLVAYASSQTHSDAYSRRVEWLCIFSILKRAPRIFSSVHKMRKNEPRPAAFETAEAPAKSIREGLASKKKGRVTNTKHSGKK